MMIFRSFHFTKWTAGQTDSREQSKGRAGLDGDEKNPITAKESSTYKTDNVRTT